MPELHFSPNVPVVLCLSDPEGHYDQDMRRGTYQTTQGQTFHLPRPAVILLNQLEPRPGEELQICKHWKGRSTDPFEWTVCLSARAEQLRASQEIAQAEAEEPSDIARRLQATIDRVNGAKPVVGLPTIIRRPMRKATAPQPQFFDQGTGTDGPQPAPAIPAPLPVRSKPVPIPWNVAFREVSRWVAQELAANNLQWSDASQQDLVSTVLINEAKAGRIGLWEREE